MGLYYRNKIIIDIGFKIMIRLFKLKFGIN